MKSRSGLSSHCKTLNQEKTIKGLLNDGIRYSYKEEKFIVYLCLYRNTINHICMSQTPYDLIDEEITVILHPFGECLNILT